MESSATNYSARLSLRVLGSFALERDTQACELAYEKGRALLAYLAVEPGRAHSRASLAGMFWPDLAHEAALNNLRQVLHNLRQTLNTAGLVVPPLHIDREFIRLDPAASLDIDVAAFCVPARACPATPMPLHCDPCLAHMETLVSRYRGEFMAGFTLPECADFEEWLQIQREALHLRALVLLGHLADCHERLGAYSRALPFALRFLELEPWNEEGLRRAMRLFAMNGQGAAALAHYDTCCRTLKRELGVSSSEQTQGLAERIRRGELSPVERRVPEPVPVVAASLPLAERRQVTVLYCELACTGVDDPDEALALLHEPQARCSALIRSYSGYVVQVRGASLLAYFGYPQASENAARLAVQAALAVAGTAFPGIERRLGVHTGMVISGDLQVPDAIGATSGLAIRLRQLVDDGEVAISGATQRLVAGYFDCVSLGLQQMRGLARAVEAFRVDRESGALDRLDAAAALTPLIGRREEVAALLSMWHDACGGTRRVVLLRGEAGIGKSRLVLTLKDALRGQACVVRELRCFPEYSHSPFHPLSALFGVQLAFSPEDTPERRFDRLAEYVATHYANEDQDSVPLLARMLSLPLRASYQEPPSSPQTQREKTLAIMLDRLYALAAEQPVLLVVEDLQWADPSTLEFLELFLAQQHGASILAVLTARPDFEPPWHEALARKLDLSGLDDAETVGLIAAVAPGIAPAVAYRIVDRADGIPLFAEELARDVALNAESAIPSSLHDLLAARLDRMGAAKIVAQTAAAIGREFRLDLLRRISPFDDAMLAQLLRQLKDAGLLCGEASGVLHFRHNLIRDAAYQLQTRSDREAVHRRIAAALTSEASQARPELLAQHWAAGGELREAVACWIEAGRLASQHAASQEAVMHFKAGLALLDALPAGPERVRLELDLQIGLGAAACAAQGYASPDGAAAYARAMSLCGQHESGPDMFRSVWGLWASASSRTGYGSALTIAQQLLRMARQSGDPVQDQQGHFALADTLYWQGEFVAARKHLERVATLYKVSDHASHVAGFGEDAGVTSGSYLSWVLCFLGFPEQARQASAQALALARQLEHPFSLAYALTFAAILHCRLQQPEEALPLAQEALSLATEHGFPLWQVGAQLSRGWALAIRNCGEGVDMMRQCVEATRAAMGGVTLVVLEPLVDAEVALEHFGAALSISQEAFATGGALGDHHVDAELHRLSGEALLGLAPADETAAASCFQEALAVSRRQQAKLLELRAAISLARLWQRQGQREDARRLLAEVYDWFTEGFDTPDLQRARQLLDSLAG